MSIRSRARIDPLGAAALVVLVGTLAASAVIVRPMLAKKGPAEPTQAARARDPKAAKSKFESSMDRHLAMIEGRSLFAIPPEPTLVKDEGPKATVYAGPQLIAYINGSAYFSDGQKVSPSQPKARTLELIRASPPWSVRVKWEGGEFDVDLFKRVPLSTLNEPMKAWTSKQAVPNPPPAGMTPAQPGTADQPALGTRGAATPPAPAGSPGLAPAASAPAAVQPPEPPHPPGEPAPQSAPQPPQPAAPAPANEPKDPPQEPSANT